MGWQINAFPFKLGTQFEQVIGSQNLLFSYLAWWFYSWNFGGEKYWIASQIRAPQNQVCNLKHGAGRIKFSPRLVVPDKLPTSAYQLPLYDDCTEYGQKSYWQCFLWVIWMYFPAPIENSSAYPTVAGSVCSLKLMHESYSSWEKMQGETEHESLNAVSSGILRPWISNEFGKSFSHFFCCYSFSSPPLFRPLQLSCVCTVWFGTQNTTATEKRYLYKRSMVLFYFRVKTAKLLDIGILYQS